MKVTIPILTATFGLVALTVPAIPAAADDACGRYDRGYSQAYGYDYGDGSYDPYSYGGYYEAYDRPAYAGHHAYSGHSRHAPSRYRDHRAYRDHRVSGGYYSSHGQGQDRHSRHRREPHRGHR